MSAFKKNQLIRVIECIGKAANFNEDKILSFVNKYLSYEEYEVAIKDLICEIHEEFSKKKNEILDYSLDMIKNISNNFFASKEEMINYIKCQKVGIAEWIK